MNVSSLYTVLNIDHVDSTRRARTAALRQAGYRVIEAADQEEAISLAEQEGPVLFLARTDSEEGFRRLTDRVPALVWVTGPEGCQYVNQAYLRFLGVDEGEVQGGQWLRFVHPDDRHPYLQAYRKAAAEGALFEAKFRVLRCDGLYRWMKSVGMPWCAESGQCLGYVGSSVDLSDLQQGTDEAGCEHDPLLALALDAAGMTAWHANFVTGAVREIVFNRPPGFMIRTIEDWQQNIHPEDYERVMAAVQVSSETNVPLDVEYRTRPNAEGEVRWVHSSGVICSFEGCPVGAYGVARDITDRKRAEESLAHNERQFRTMFDLAATGITLLDARTGRFIEVNDRFCEISGYSRDELTAMSPVDLTHPDDRGRDMVGFGKLLRGEIDEYHVEKRYLRKDGTVRWVVVSVRLLRDDKGQPLRTTAVVQDVTDRKRAEDSLQESQERMRLFIDHAPAAIAMFDRDMRYLAVSRRWLEDYGLSGTILGRTHYDVFPEISERWKKLHQRGLAGETLSEEVDRFERADGTVQWLKWQMHPWRTAAGEVGGIVLFTEDITQRMLAEELLRTATEHARVGLAVLDAERRYSFVNPAYRELFNLTGTFMIGRPMQDVLGSLDEDTCQCLDRVYAGERVSYELRVPDDEGVHRTYAVICEPRFEPGLDRVAGMVTVVTDMTERKRAQEDLARVYGFTRHVVDIVPNLIFAKDRDGRFTLVNKAVADCYGTTVDELLGKTDADFNPNAAEVEHFKRVDREVLATGREHRCEERITDRAGRVRWLETVKRPICDEHGIPIQVLGSATDVTERKEAEAELQAIAWLLRERSVPSRVPDPQPYGDLTALNKTGTILRTVGRDLLDSITSDVMDLLDSSGVVLERSGEYASARFSSPWCRFMDAASHRRCGTDDLGAALAGGRWHCQESCRAASDRAMDAGEPVDMPCNGGINLYAVPIRVDGETLGSIDIGYGDPPKDEPTLAQLAERYGVELEELRRISHSMPSRPRFIVEVAKARLRSSAVLLGEIIKRKRVEEELRQLTEHLEVRIAERTEALVQSQVQLRALATELNLTEQRERKRLATELHDYLAQMLVLVRLKLGQSRQVPGVVPQCAHHLAQADEVLADALKYTRTLVADLSPPILYEFGLPAALTWLAERMKRHELAVTIEASGVADITLPEEQTVLLFQSVRELLMNAAKYAGSGRATVALAAEDGVLRLTVRDYGKGFDMTAAASHGTKSGTTKFGLFSIRERMKAMGGRFDLQSKPGEGTTATLTLPLPAPEVRDARDKEGEPDSAQKRASSRSPGSPVSQSAAIRVLLVDDHAMVRQGLRSVLDTYPDVEIVGEAWNGDDAVARVEELQPSVVVMDINMPRVNGIDATARIKERYPAVIVIGLSVQPERENQSAMEKAGAAALLTKEAAVDELYRAIQKARSGVS